MIMSVVPPIAIMSSAATEELVGANSGLASAWRHPTLYLTHRHAIVFTCARTKVCFEVTMGEKAGIALTKASEIPTRGMLQYRATGSMH